MTIHERVDVLVVEDNESERGSIVETLQSSYSRRQRQGR